MLMLLLGETLAGFQQVCTIEVDLSSMASILQKKKQKSRSCFGKSKAHWVLDYRIAFMFGATELKAFVVWEDKVRKHLLCGDSSRCSLSSMVYRE